MSHTRSKLFCDGQAISFPQSYYIPDNQDDALAAGQGYLKTDEDGTYQKDEFGIPWSLRGSTLYFCFQSIFKIQPVFDYIISSILHADKNGRLILQAWRNSYQTEMFIKRLTTYLVDAYVLR